MKRCILHTNVLKYSIVYRNPVSQVEFHGEIQIIVPSWSDCLSLLVFACHSKYQIYLKLLDLAGSAILHLRGVITSI